MQSFSLYLILYLFITKALRLMREKTKIDAYFKVHLEKVVPIQAGLGGGRLDIDDRW
jgi:4-diphosphocytidyl-2C-methyl-D-erythritol kinase